MTTQQDQVHGCMRPRRTWTVGALAAGRLDGWRRRGRRTVVGPADRRSPAQEAVEAVTLVHADDVRGNLTLPTSGLNGATLAWSSGAPEVVTDTGEVTRPAYGEAPVEVPLTVTGTVADGASTATATIEVEVQALPAAGGLRGLRLRLLRRREHRRGGADLLRRQSRQRPARLRRPQQRPTGPALDLRHPRPARPLHHPLGGGRPLLPAGHRPQGLSGRRLRRGAGDRQQVRRGVGVDRPRRTGRTSGTSRCPRTSPATRGRRRRSTTRRRGSTSSTGPPRSTRRPTPRAATSTRPTSR